MSVAAHRRTAWQMALAIAVLALQCAVALALGWYGAKGEWVDGFKSQDHWPVWRQYILHALTAFAALCVLAFTARARGKLIRRSECVVVGLWLAIPIVLWGGTLFTFALWGGDPVRALLLAGGAIAPALSIPVALVALGWSDRRWVALTAALVVLASGAAATASVFPQ